MATAAKKHKIEVLIYPLHDGDKNATYERWDDLRSNKAVKTFQCGVRLDISDRTDLVQMIYLGIYPYQFFVDGKPVPNAIVEVTDSDGVSEQKAQYARETANDLKKKPEATDQEKALYDYIISL